MIHEFIVEELKTRLDKYLAKQLPEISRSSIQRDIEGGQAEVNGQPITESKFTVRLNDKVVYKVASDKLQVTELKPTNTPLKVLYNNHGLLIIDKSAGMVVHQGAGFMVETLASALLYHFSAKGGSQPKADQPLAGAINSGGKDDISVVGEDHRPGIVHRLDKDTSGVMLVARTPKMYEYLKDAFLERKVKKEYIALVWGEVSQPHGFIETPIGKSKTDFRKQTVKDPVEGKQALTEYQVLEYLGSDKSENRRIGESDKTVFSDLRPPTSDSSDLDGYTLIMVKLHTGRTHQIRVHLASIGHPLLGDELYGNKKTRLPGLYRQFLHAKKIEVQLPDKTWIEAESEFPEDLGQVLVSLNSKVVKEL
jgi:23S rRNA pseudouridine1911/1915/1917 synthase